MKKEILRIVKQAITEDAARQDITSNLLIGKNHISTAEIITKEPAVICGLDIAKKVFQTLGKGIKFQLLCKDGQFVKANRKVARIKGKTRLLLAGERVALNFLGHLSGIATKTRSFVKKASPYRTKIMDTRKTTPGLRVLEKYAVKCGGGYNHRLNLSEAIFIKDNHWAAGQQSLAKVMKRIRTSTKKPIIIEVENLKQCKEALKTKPDVILLDNMRLAQIKKAVELIRKQKQKISLEVSGGVNAKNIRSFAKTGVDRISVGELTHSTNSVDMTLELTI